MAEAKKASKKSLGLRRSSLPNKRKHPMSQSRFIQLMYFGGSARVQNDQIAKAMVSAMVHPKANQDTVRALANHFS